MALRTSSPARAASAISPLRTPRERAWPRPMMFRLLAAVISPATTQIFEVPISRPTMMEEESNMFPFWARRFEGARGHRRNGGGRDPMDGQIILNGKVERRDGFAAFLVPIV